MSLEKSKFAQIDFILFFSVLFLVILGAAIVYSASSFEAEETVRAQLLRQAETAKQTGNEQVAENLLQKAENVDGTTYYIKKQAMKIGLGFMVMMLFAMVDYKKWLILSPAFFLVSVFLLVLLFTNLSFVVSKGEASRWLRFGGFTLQPSDFARYALILLMSRLLIDYKDRVDDLKTFLSFLGLIGFVVLLVAMETDLGSAIMIAFISFSILFLARIQLKYLLATFTTTVTLTLLYLQTKPYMLKRLWEYLTHVGDQGEPSYQIMQSLISFGTGGLFGVGIGNSYQKFDFLPEAYKDMIFSIIGEELGLIGTLGVLGVFLIIFYRGMMIAKQAPNDYGRLLAGAITLCIVLYAFMNAAVALGLIPTTGIPMPFISYGGSALVSHMGAVGIMLNISSQSASSYANYPSSREFDLRLDRMPFHGSSRMSRRKG